ncbi:hypothetical protein G5I_13002 [Acromyrmex echinatior]|uniref:Abnormal spindle-like microcephaly-associated protein-like protein n=1 Tax=Acromyrmex echinatior TaxID=103372 RepID=F4X3T9_ACREC|nr:hypothetical protein G5I_13002 [Acromyrmex echinatior]
MSQTSKEDADAMKANTAATKIQANFRGYRVRKQLKESTQRRRQQQQNQQDQKRNQQQQQQQEHMKPKEHLLKRQSTQEALEEKSATKIQAGIRGFLVRKRQQAVQAAATRIQAGFRGFRTRKLLKQNGLRLLGESIDGEVVEDIGIAPRLQALMGQTSVCEAREAVHAATSAAIATADQSVAAHSPRIAWTTTNMPGTLQEIDVNKIAKVHHIFIEFSTNFQMEINGTLKIKTE